MKTHRLKIPLTEEDVRPLRVGDFVYLDGLIHTGRALQYEMLLDKGAEPSIDIAKVCNVQMHAAPAAQEDAPGVYRISSIQATASFRYWKWVPEYVERFGIRALIGKAGMDKQIYESVFARTGTVFLTTVGYGVAALYGRGVRKVHDVYFKDELGLPEAMWVIEVENFGPFIVDGDTNGDSLADQSIQSVNKNFREAYARLPQHILKRMGEIDETLGDEVIVDRRLGCPDVDTD